MEVKQAIKEWADGVPSTPDGDQPVELLESGGAIITAIEKEVCDVD